MLLQPHGRALAACRGVVAGSFGESGHNALRGTQEDVFRGVTASASKAIGATPVNRATVAAGRARPRGRKRLAASGRSEEHTSELQSLMLISYAVFCLKKKNNMNEIYNTRVT